MTLATLKARALAVFILAVVLATIILFASVGEAIGLVITVGSVGGVALIVWTIATVADAAVQTLKKEN